MTIKENQARLRNLAITIRDGGVLNEADKLFLSDALLEIADGKDANIELKVIGKVGVSKGKSSQDAEKRKHLAMGWLATAIAPENEGGLGLTIEKARGIIGENNLYSFKFTEETLKSYWRDNLYRRTRSF